MMKKPLLLFLALLLPTCIFLFLHYFGRNEFEIPVYYTSPTEEMPSICEKQYEFPYKVNTSLAQLTGPTVFFFMSGLSKETLGESIFQLSRLGDEFSERAPKLILLTQTSSSLLPSDGPIVLDTLSYVYEQKCIFLAGKNQLVLVDADRQIRGFYPNASLKEVDRLILELKILLKEY